MESLPPTAIDPVRQSLAAKVVTHFSDQIREGRLPDGTRLPTEDQLTEELKVSRSPLREAIKILEAQGILEIRRGVGTFVCEGAQAALRHLSLFQLLLRDARAKELAELRMMIERTAAEFAARNRSDAQLKTIMDANAELERIVRSVDADIDRMTDADVEFHSAIFDACGNRLVSSIGKFVVEMMRPMIRASLLRLGGMNAVTTHALVVEMIARQEGDLVIGTAEKLVGVGLDRWMQSLEHDGRAPAPTSEDIK